MIIDNKSYTGNGSTRQFSTSVNVLSNSHIAVFLDDVLQSTSSYDLLGSVVLFKTAPSNNVAINFVVSDTGEDLPSSPSQLTAIYTHITEIENLNAIINYILSLESIKAQISSLGSISSELSSIYTDRLAILGTYEISSDIVSLNAIKTKIESIFNDLYVLNSVYTDKATLDSIYASKTTLDGIYAELTKLIDVHTNLASIITTSNNINSVNTVANNIVDVNTFSVRYKINSVAPTGISEGTLWYDTVNSVVKYYNGISWVAVTPDLNAIDDYLGSLVTEVLI